MIASPGPIMVTVPAPGAVACPDCGGTVLRLDVATDSLDCVGCGAALCRNGKELCPECGTDEHDNCLLSEYDNWNDALRDAVHDLELEGGLVDNGIGHYEYWGAKGCHSHVEFEVDDEKDAVIFWTEDPMVPDEPPRYELRVDKVFHHGKDEENSSTVEVTATLLEHHSTRAAVGFGSFVYRHRAVYRVGP